MISLLPPQSTVTERALESAAARIETVPHPLDILWNPWSCPVKILSWLAWALSVDDWNPAWPERVQRQVIAAALKVHRYKGTPGAVRLALEVLDFNDVRVTEWFGQAPPGKPYTFSIDMVAEHIIRAVDWHGLKTAIWNAKNLRSHLSVISLIRTHKSPVPVLATALMTGHIGTVYPAIIREHTVRGPLHFGAGLQVAISQTIYPRSKTSG